MPDRIQMSRQKPWRAEHPDAVIVDRRSKWGNPFSMRRDDDGNWFIYEDGLMIDPAGSKEEAREGCVEIFRLAVNPAAPKGSLPDYPMVADMQRELAGKDLACWCMLSDPCHADVLLELANGAPDV